jgi:serine phosphatase RsbU (regulator of sigma subunit)
MMRGARAPVSQTLFVAFISGTFAAGVLFGFVRRLIKFSILWIVFFIVGQGWLPQASSGQLPLSQAANDRAQLLDRIKIEGAVAAAAIFGAYALVLAFLQKEGERVFAHITEVRLAQEVHQTLVPGLAQKIAGYEIYGASVPSGQVGGDLVDLVEVDGRWMAYVADVSGHGVPAGMIMAMVKSAVRMGSTDRTFPDFLRTLNRVLLSLLAPNVFVTFACVAGNSGSELTFALAGHLPVLHYRRCHGVVEERSVCNLPLAILPDAELPRRRSRANREICWSS